MGKELILYFCGIAASVFFTLSMATKKTFWCIISLVLFILMIVSGLYLLRNNQKSHQKDPPKIPVSHITVQKALETGEHLYIIDSVTGAMVHSPNCPNPLNNDKNKNMIMTNDKQEIKNTR